MFKTNLNAVSSDVTDVNDYIVAPYRIGGRYLLPAKNIQKTFNIRHRGLI